MPLNGDLTNNGITNANITNSNATISNDGKIGKCYSFNGNSQKLTSILPLAISSSIGTLACWIKFNAFPTSGKWMCLMQLGTSGGFASCRLGVYMEYTNGINICIDGSTTAENLYTHSLSTNTWYHLCATNDGTNVKLYLNGEVVLSKIATKGTYTTSASNLYIGGTNNYYLNGCLNDIRYYDTCLSPKEVEILARGLVVHYPLSLPMPNLLPHTTPSYGLGYMSSYGSGTVAVDSTELFCGNSTIRIQPTSSNTSSGGTNYYNSDSVKLTSGVKYCYSCWIKSTVDDTFTTGSLGHFQTVTSSAVHNRTVHFEGMEIPANKWTQVYIVFTPSADCSFRSFFIYFANTSQKIWVSKVKLEQGDHPTPYCPGSGDTEYSSMGFNDTIEYDVSGYKYNGTKIGSLTYSSDTPRYSTSTSFNGVDDCIQVPLNTFFPNAGSFTINLWFKKHELGSKNYETVFGGISGFEMDTRGGASTTLSYYVTGNGRGLTVQSPLNFDTWYMLTMVCDGTNELYYLNGEYKKQIEKKGMPSGNYFIGAWRDSVSQNFKGLISDFRVYATALTATQVAELYNTAISISNNGTLMGYELIEQ